MISHSDSERVRELCLRLKPIMGEQMERIFAAYCAADAQGKEQIERYLELAAAKYIPQRLERSQSDLLPPTEKEAAGGYPLGLVQYAGKSLCEFGLREEEWIQHVAVLGRSGAGKTNVGFVLLRELRRKGKPFLVFDWKRNYRDLLSLPEFADIEIYTIGRDVAPLRFNPLIPPAGTNPKTWLKKLNEVIAHSYCLGNGVLFLLQQTVDAVYKEAGVYDGTVQTWPTFKDVLRKARDMDVRGREAGWLSSTLRALSAMCFGEMDSLLNTNNNRSLTHIVESRVVLELDALTQSDKVFFVQALLLWLHHTRMAQPKRESFKHAVLIEEAHHVLSDERRSLIGGQSVMEIIFREVREFGEALVLLDQHPSKISLPALGNTYCTICMNLKHRTDINAMAQCLLLDKEKDLLGSLEVGEAVVKLQGRIAGPFVIRVPEFAIHKGALTDAMLAERMCSITQSVTANTAAAMECNDLALSGSTSEVQVQTAARISVRRFLEDIRDHPDSGIAARYKRLGLSARQGQKLKMQLIDDSLADQYPVSTGSARIGMLRLTPKGLSALYS